MDKQNQGGLRDWITGTDSMSTKSSSTQHTNRPSLDEEYQLLTERVVQLKMELATWKGKQDEINLNRQQLNVEAEALREEIELIDTECITYQDDTNCYQDKTTIELKRLEQLRLSSAIEEETAVPLRIEHESLLNELHAAQNELKRVQAEKAIFQKEIDELERKKLQVASEQSRIDSEVQEMIAGNENIQREIDIVQQLIEKLSREKVTIPAEIAKIKKETAAICRKNSKIEARIVAVSNKQTS